MFDSWILDANTALAISLVTADSSKEFHPEFTYPVFGEDQVIFGYKDLKIKLYYCASTLVAYLGISYQSLITHVQPQDVVKMITAIVPNPYFNYDDFIQHVHNNDFVPMGDKIHSYATADATYEYYKCTFETKRFKQYHSRLQQLLIWFIEGASYIDHTDDCWQIILVFRKINNRYDIVGYVTWYPFFHFPDKFIIFPPHQRKGHGLRLYSFLYQMFLSDEKVHDITVEDPNDSFQDMRDRHDVSFLLDCGYLASFSMDKAVKLSVNDANRQATRVTEMIMLHRLNKYDAQSYAQYRLWVKQRLYKQNKDALMEVEFGDRIAKLQHTFDNVEQDYRAILKSIST